MANLEEYVEISFTREWGVSEFHPRTVLGKNENLYASVRVVTARLCGTHCRAIMVR